MLTHFRLERDRYFHFHPWHGTFSLIMSIVLAVLLVLIFVPSAR
jgi:hypothetical protein